MIREIASVRELVAETVEKAEAGKAVSAVILLAYPSGEFDVVWSVSVEHGGVVGMLGQLEVLKRDLLRKMDHGTV